MVSGTTPINWVFLRGWARDARHWHDFPEVFQTAFPDARVTLLDLSGNGSRWQQTSPSSVADMVDDYRDQLKARSISGPVALLAVSLGGMVALEWGRRHPAEVACAVLVNSSVGQLSPLFHRLAPSAWMTLLSLAFSRDAHRIESGILRLISNRDTRQLAKNWALYRQNQPTRLANAIRQLWAAGQYVAPSTIETPPMLVLASQGDRMVNHRCSVRISEHYGWPLSLHSSAGHDLPLDDPHWMAMRIKDWLGPKTNRAR